MLVAVFDPLDGSTEIERGGADGDVLPVHDGLGPEGPADVAADARERASGAFPISPVKAAFMTRVRSGFPTAAFSMAGAISFRATTMAGVACR